MLSPTLQFGSFQHQNSTPSESSCASMSSVSSASSFLHHANSSSPGSSPPSPRSPSPSPPAVRSTSRSFSFGSQKLRSTRNSVVGLFRKSRVKSKVQPTTEEQDGPQTKRVPRTNTRGADHGKKPSSVDTGLMGKHDTMLAYSNTLDDMPFQVPSLLIESPDDFMPYDHSSVSPPEMHDCAPIEPQAELQLTPTPPTHSDPGPADSEEQPPLLNSETHKLEIPRSVSMPVISPLSPLRNILFSTGQKAPASVLCSNDLGMCCDIFDNLSRLPDIPIPDSFRSPRRTRKQSRTVTTLHFLDAMRNVCLSPLTPHGAKTFLKQTIGRLQLSDAYNTYDDLTFFELIELLEQSAAMTLVMLGLAPNHATMLLTPLWVECGKYAIDLSGRSNPTPQPVRRVVSVSGASLTLKSGSDRQQSGTDSASQSEQGTPSTHASASADGADSTNNAEPAAGACATASSEEVAPKARLVPPINTSSLDMFSKSSNVVQRASSLETPSVRVPAILPQSPDSAVVAPSSAEGIKALVNAAFVALATEGAQGITIEQHRLATLVNQLLGGNPKHHLHLFLVEVMQQLEDSRSTTRHLYVGDFTCMMMRATAGVRRMSTNETWSPAACLSVLESVAASPAYRQSPFVGVKRQDPSKVKGVLRTPSPTGPTSVQQQVKFGSPTIFVRRQTQQNGAGNDRN